MNCFPVPLSPVIRAGLAPLKVAAFTQGENIPSARFRVRQVIDPLARHGIMVHEVQSRYSAYPPVSTWKRPWWLMHELASRVPQLVAAHEHDLSIIQREFISTLPSLELFSARPRIFDVDDAIWLRRGGIAADFIARHSDYMVCGNTFLADYFSKFHKETTVISTAVDVDRFRPLAARRPGRPILGWSGTSAGYHYFGELERPLADLLKRYPDWMLRIVSNCKPAFKLIPEDRIDFVEWSETNEAETIAEMDIGLMPLDDSLWSRGKCSYKMLLYMSSGVAVVVSDVGMNSEILRQGRVGIGVSAPDEWCEAIEGLMRDEALRRMLGANGRKLVIDKYSLASAADSWVDVIRKVAG